MAKAELHLTNVTLNRKYEKRFLKEEDQKFDDEILTVTIKYRSVGNTRIITDDMITAYIYKYMRTIERKKPQ